MGVLSEGAVLQVTDRPPKEPQGSNTVLLAGSTLSDLGVLDHGVVMINGHPFDARPHGAVPEGCVALDSMQCETMDAFIGETVRVAAHSISLCASSFIAPPFRGHSRLHGVPYQSLTGNTLLCRWNRSRNHTFPRLGSLA
jgi:hypothetical protein